ncbi:nucleotidyltransferase domain-containing protein [Flavobacterium oreochromis]|uniref:nucleotidyltransferase domain-containing protein n=1 Tax=Flavobacterium oreochromis TaxID=2906078 RepID=UPI000CDAB47F|nr:hypothetical protein BWK58_11895 [Flavobacterium columnare]
MTYKLIYNFLNKHFQEIESVILFGSYVDNPDTANDIDLLLMSDKFLYSSKESFFFERKKINIIKINSKEVFSILAKHFLQGDFYRLVFSKGIILIDRNKDLHFVRHYVKTIYPQRNNNIKALALNESLFKLAEYQDVLRNKLSCTEWFMVTTKIISHLIDWFLLTNDIYDLKSEKYKSRYFDKFFPLENLEIQKLIFAIQKNSPKKFLDQLQILVKEYNIPIKVKYSTDLIFDDYSMDKLILYVENLFNFQEIRKLTSQLKSLNKSLSFYIYQVDEENHESKGCYIVFDNSKSEFGKNRDKWLELFQIIFSQYQYTFPYNNIFCYPEIKFIGKENEKSVDKLLFEWINTIDNKDVTREELFIFFMKSYVSKVKIKIDDVYNFYLSKLNAKTRSSNYLIQKNKEVEQKFLIANSENEKRLVDIFEKIKKNDLKIEFSINPKNPLWFHIQVIDRVISILLKNDFEKLFYTHCLKNSK